MIYMPVSVWKRNYLQTILSCIRDPEFCSSVLFLENSAGLHFTDPKCLQICVLRCKATENNLNTQVEASADGCTNRAPKMGLLPATVQHDFYWQTSSADMQSHTCTHLHTHVRVFYLLMYWWVFYLLMYCVKLNFYSGFFFFFAHDDCGWWCSQRLEVDTMEIKEWCWSELTMLYFPRQWCKMAPPLSAEFSKTCWQTDSQDWCFTGTFANQAKK